MLLILIFYPVRHVFTSSYSTVLGIYSDFTSLSLYLSDIFIVFLAIFTAISNFKEFSSYFKGTSVIFLVSLLFASFILSITNSDFGLALYITSRIAELIVLHGTIKILFKYINLTKSIHFFIALLSVQAILTLIQLAFQHNIGIRYLGESVISTQILGVAKVIASGFTYIRPYGTFPHPNVLSAFFVTGIPLAIYSLISAKSRLTRMTVASALALIIFGLFLTFSRAGILAGAVSFIIFLAGLIYIKLDAKKIIYLATIGLIASISMFVLAKPFLLSRNTVSDEAISLRSLYNHIGVKIITANPVFGVGPGQALLHMQQFSPVHLEPWDIQPIHNVFLEAVAELGVPLALLFLFIFLWFVKELFSNLKKESLTENQKLLKLALGAILVSYFILMQFDHYFYTIEQTRLLFVGVIAFVYVIIQNEVTSSPG